MVALAGIENPFTIMSIKDCREVVELLAIYQQYRKDS